MQHCQAKWDSRAAVGVVLAAGGYPESYRQGDVISGLLSEHNVDTNSPDKKVFHAGTALKGDQVITQGGRVLCATALGETVTEAQANAYELARQIQWHDVYYRNDIAYRAVEREQSTQ